MIAKQAISLRKAPTKAELSGQSSVKALLENREHKMLTES